MPTKPFEKLSRAPTKRRTRVVSKSKTAAAIREVREKNLVKARKARAKNLRAAKKAAKG